MSSIKKQLKFFQAYQRIHASVFRAKDVINAAVLVRMQGYTQLRTDYVLQENWPIHASGIDMDEYDQQAHTRYVVASTGLRVVAGLRVTPVARLESSLSYHMWNNAQDRVAFLKRLHAQRTTIKSGSQYQLYDISRLVTEASIMSSRSERTRYDSRAGLMKVLALATSIHEPGVTPLWIFTTTEKIRVFMEKNSFDVHILSHGRISISDAGDSYLCYVEPHSVIAQLKKKNPVLYLIATHQKRKLIQ